jgi:hypothetical protein
VDPLESVGDGVCDITTDGVGALVVGVVLLTLDATGVDAAVEPEDSASAVLRELDVVVLVLVAEVGLGL